MAKRPTINASSTTLRILRTLRELTDRGLAAWTESSTDTLRVQVGSLTARFDFLYPEINDRASGADALRVTLGRIQQVFFSNTPGYVEALETINAAIPARRTWAARCVDALEEFERALEDMKRGRTKVSRRKGSGHRSTMAPSAKRVRKRRSR